MSISRQNLTVVIVTLKSEKVIHSCIKSIDEDMPVIIVENSNNEKFKEDLEKRYHNVKCVLAKKNIGMGAGNNIGIKLAKTDYVFVLNPDTTFEANTLNEIFLASQKLNDFTILSPISTKKDFPNYGTLNKKKILEKNDHPFKVDYVDGFAMVINKNKFRNNNYFDEKFFMYLENDDLCMRVVNEGGSIFVIPSAKINHIGAGAVNHKFIEEIELSRNWHWIWSKFYFNKKNFGILKALKVCLTSYISSIIKFLFYFIVGNKFKKRKYFNRAAGFYNALLGKDSWYRPDLKD